MNYLFALLCFLPGLLKSEEMVKVLAISKSKKTFIVRTGFEKHVSPGSLAAFLAEDFSFTARANVVTREYAQWELITPGLVLPFKMNDLLIFSKNVEDSQRQIRPEEGSRLDQHELLVGLNGHQYLSQKEKAINDHLNKANYPKEKKFNWEQYLKTRNGSDPKKEESSIE